MENKNESSIMGVARSFAALTISTQFSQEKMAEMWKALCDAGLLGIDPSDEKEPTGPETVIESVY